MSGESSVIVHVIDDDPGMRKSLSMLIESASLPVRAYESAEEFLSDADLKIPACIVLDIRMTGISGIELLQRLRAEMVDTPVVLISGHADVPTTVRGMKLGAVDLLQKPIEPSVLIDTVQRSIDTSVAMHRHHTHDESIRHRFETLTQRESELLKRIVQGQSNKQIAFELEISVKTVANHRASLMNKTSAVNAADLARLYTIVSAARKGGHTAKETPQK
jgi:two-component system, LuxR family, response regulator FixJ